MKEAKRLSVLEEVDKKHFTIYKAAESATYLNSEPVLSSGRLELTHFLREVAISSSYHRYGNLGTREGESRAKIR